MTSAPRVLFLGHAAERTGPPLILRDLLRWIRAHTEIEVGVALLDGGPLLADYEALGPTWVLRDWLEPGPASLAWRALHKLRLPGVAERVRDAALRRPARGLGDWPIVYVNSVGTVRLLPLLPAAPQRVIAHVHELSTGLEHHLAPEARDLLFSRADRVITVSQAVTDEVVRTGLAPPDDVVCIHGFIDLDPPAGPTPPTRGHLGIAEDAFVIGSAGLRHWRKAPDLFVSVAHRVAAALPDAHFLWVGGHHDDPAGRFATRDVERARLADRVTFVDHQDHPRDWLRLFDVFFLSAREDAFPLVCLEAASVGVPIVCFTSGGAAEFVGDDAGTVVPYPDLDAAAAALLALSRDRDRRAALGGVGAARVRAEHGVDTVAPRIVAEIRAVAS